MQKMLLNLIHRIHFKYFYMITYRPNTFNHINRMIKVYVISSPFLWAEVMDLDFKQ